jgi:CheY-like chemotaxis protein
LCHFLHTQVTQCSSGAEALARLEGSCSFDVLLADKPSISSSSELDALLKAAEGLPCVLMASNPSPEDVMAGVCVCCSVPQAAAAVLDSVSYCHVKQLVCVAR